MTSTTKPALAEAPATASVSLRVTRLGAGRISTGEHAPGDGDAVFAKGEILELSREAAAVLEDLGLAEIVEAP